MNTIEEKAKAYDDALERAKRIKDGKGNWRFSDLSVIEPAATEIVPVLAESEVERIRWYVIRVVKDWWRRIAEVTDDGKWPTEEEMLAYLEKQKEQKSALTPERIHPKFAVGDTVCRPMWSDHTIREIYVRCNDPVYVCVNEEGTESHISLSEQDEWERKEQKPVEWSEDERRKLNRIFQILGQAAEDKGFLTSKRIIGDKEAIELQDFLRSIAKPGDRPAEWSEKDEAMRGNILRVLRCFVGTVECESAPSLSTSYPLYLREIDWLKSLSSRPKSSDNLPKWKKASAGTKLPSESVIRRDGEDPRFGSVAVYDCEYITINELGKLPKED